MKLTKDEIKALSFKISEEIKKHNSNITLSKQEKMAAVKEFKTLMAALNVADRAEKDYNKKAMDFRKKWGVNISYAKSSNNLNGVLESIRKLKYVSVSTDTIEKDLTVRNIFENSENFKDLEQIVKSFAKEYVGQK